MLTATTDIPARTTTGIEIDPKEAKRLLDGADTVLVDCREPDEFARERIAGSKPIPLGLISTEQLKALGARRVIIHCRSGRRSLDAATRCSGLAEAGVEVLSMAGGIEAWRGAGFQTVVDSQAPRMGVIQQTQIAVGLAVLAGTALGAFVHPAFLAIPTFLGCGLVYAGASGTCGLATLIAMAPWNKLPTCERST